MNEKLIADHEASLSRIIRETVRSYCENNGLKTTMAADYRCPPLAIKNPPVTFRVGRCRDLIDALEATRVAASQEKTRYYLNGVYLESGGAAGGLTLVATDGHRVTATENIAGRYASDVISTGALLINKVGHKHCWPGKEPVDYIKTALAFLRKLRKTESVLITIGDDFIEFSNGVLVPLRVPHPQVTYPDWRRVLPRLDGPTVVRTFDAKAMQRWLKAVIRTAREDRAYHVLMRLSDTAERTVAFYTSHGSDGAKSNSSPVPEAVCYTASLTGAAGRFPDVGFNARYILDMLPKSGTVKIVTLAEYCDGPSSIVCQDGYVRAIMPIRL